MRRQLEHQIGTLGSAVVGFSAGVDSSVVAAASHNALGSRCHVVLAITETITREDVALARRIAGERAWNYREIVYNELEIPNYAANPVDRCYWCKDALYDRLSALAEEVGAVVLDGSNADDRGDYRPGRRAASQRGVRSPLLELGISKERVRELAERYGLPNHDKPASPCLSSRVPYGTPITPEIIDRIDRAERAMRAFGFPIVRVRHHGDVARLEVPRSDLPRAVEMAAQIDEHLRSCGYRFVSLDLAGFSSGALNAMLVDVLLPNDRA